MRSWGQVKSKEREVGVIPGGGVGGGGEGPSGSLSQGGGAKNICFGPRFPLRNLGSPKIMFCAP